MGFPRWDSGGGAGRGAGEGRGARGRGGARGTVFNSSQFNQVLRLGLRPNAPFPRGSSQLLSIRAPELSET